MAGCGGDGDGGERLSHRQLASRADAICRRFERQIDALAQPRSMGELAQFAREAKAIFEDGLDELRALEPPEDVEATYDEWIAIGDDTVRALDRAIDAAEDGDEAEVLRIQEETAALNERADGLAEALAFESCGS